MASTCSSMGESFSRELAQDATNDYRVHGGPEKNCRKFNAPSFCNRLQ